MDGTMVMALTSAWVIVVFAIAILNYKCEKYFDEREDDAQD